MIGYFPQPEPGELFISVMARAKRLLLPAQASMGISKVLLGGASSFGWSLPNNCRSVQENILPIARPSDECIIDGSIYHLMSPFITAKQRETVLTGIFDGGSGTRGLVEYSPLRYCVKCANRDKEMGIPQHWRVLSNHPAVTCCDIHGVYLTTSNAMPSKPNRTLYDPGEWINLDVETQDRATELEIEIARRARWIYDQKSKFNVDSRSLKRALRVAVQCMPRARASLKITNAQLFDDLREYAGGRLDRIDPDFGKAVAGRRPWVSMTLARCLLVSCFAEIGIDELFERSVYDANDDLVESKTEWARQEIEAIRAENPEINRQGISAINSAAVRFLYKTNKEEYERIMPVNRSNQNQKIDWGKVDEEYTEKIRSLTDKNYQEFSTQTDALISAEISPCRYSRNKGRLPKTRAAIQSLKIKLVRKKGSRPPDDLRKMDREKKVQLASKKLDLLMLENPNLSSSKLRRLDSSLWHILSVYAPEKMPKRARLDWPQRDQKLANRLEKLRYDLCWESKKSFGSILKALGESQHLLNHANGRLPKTERLLGTLLVRGPSPAQIEEAKLVILSIVAENPGISCAGAEKINQLCIGRLKRRAPEFINSVFRVGRKHVRQADWLQRDIDYVEMVSAALPRISGPDRSSPRRILRSAGIDPSQLITAKGRIPKTVKLLEAAVIPFDSLEDKRCKLLQLVRSNPNLGRLALHQLNRTVVDGVMKFDREFYENVMPAPRTTRRSD